MKKKIRLNLPEMYGELCVGIDAIRNESEGKTQMELAILFMDKLKKAMLKISKSQNTSKDIDRYLTLLQAFRDEIVEEVLGLEVVSEGLSDPSRAKLVLLFYSLLRDYLPAGEVEKLVREIEEFGNEDIYYSNIDLVQYARKLAKRVL